MSCKHLKSAPSYTPVITMRTEDSTWLLRGCIICFLSYLTVAETIKTKNSCLTTDKDRILLTCNPGEMIHVISFLYQTASENCSTVDGECQVLQQSTDDGLLLSCNGNLSCNESISNSKMKNECNHTTPVHVTLTYGCISESPMDVCSNISQTFDQQVYLISPDYLERKEDFPSVPCECEISGSDISVEILEVKLPYFSEGRANITLLGESGSWSSNPVLNFLQYNKLVLNQSDNLALFYDARGNTGQDMWLRLQASANITVQCNRQPTTTTLSTPTAAQLNVTSAGLGTSGKPLTTTTSFTTVTESSSAQSSANKFLPGKQGQSNVTAIAVGSVFAVIVVTLIIAVVVFILMRRKRLKPYLGSKEKLERAYSSPRANSEDNLHTYALSLAAIDASDNQSSDVVPSPSSHQSFELEPYARQRSASLVEHCGQAAASSQTNDSPPSGLPYTNKKLEELYAKVIPKKFRSTKELREKKGKEKEKNEKNKSKSSVNSDGYESIDVAGKTSSKSRASSSKSDHDYQEIDSIRPASDSVFAPPVPSKMDGIQEELDTVLATNVNDDSENKALTETPQTQEPNVHITQHMKGSQEDLGKNGYEDLRDKTIHSKSSQSKKKIKSSSDDNVVMIDNVLYEKTPPAESHGQSTKKKSEFPQSDVHENHYSSIPLNERVTAKEPLKEKQSRKETKKKKEPEQDISKHEARSSDNDLVMVDNVLYEGGPAKEDAENATKRTSNPYEEIDKVGGNDASKPTNDAHQRKKSSPNEEIMI